MSRSHLKPNSFAFYTYTLDEGRQNCAISVPERFKSLLFFTANWLWTGWYSWPRGVGVNSTPLSARRKYTQKGQFMGHPSTWALGLQRLIFSNPCYLYCIQYTLILPRNMIKFFVYNLEISNFKNYCTYAVKHLGCILSLNFRRVLPIG